MNLPQDLKYTNDHEWIKVEGNIGTIGITEHAQGELGDVVYVDISADISSVRAGDSFGTIEAVKTVADLYAPVSGNVVEINKTINDNPEIVNKDPYGAGWMIKIDMSNPEELDFLLDVTAYSMLIGE